MANRWRWWHYVHADDRVPAAAVEKHPTTDRRWGRHDLHTCAGRRMSGTYGKDWCMANRWRWWHYVHADGRVPAAAVKKHPTTDRRWGRHDGSARAAESLIRHSPTDALLMHRQPWRRWNYHGEANVNVPTPRRADRTLKRRRGRHDCSRQSDSTSKANAPSQVRHCGSFLFQGCDSTWCGSADPDGGRGHDGLPALRRHVDDRLTRHCSVVGGQSSILAGSASGE
jgi:hypothetical protein